MGRLRALLREAPLGDRQNTPFTQGTVIWSSELPAGGALAVLSAPATRSKQGKTQSCAITTQTPPHSRQPVSGCRLVSEMMCSSRGNPGGRESQTSASRSRPAAYILNRPSHDSRTKEPALPGGASLPDGPPFRSLTDCLLDAVLADRSRTQCPLLTVGLRC